MKSLKHWLSYDAEMSWNDIWLKNDVFLKPWFQDCFKQLLLQLRIRKVYTSDRKAKQLAS